MTIYLSASSIKDYLVCEARVKYKFEIPKDAILVESREMLIGRLVHYVLEKEWEDKDKGLLLAYDLLDSYNLLESDYNDIAKYLTNFYTHFLHLCSKDDRIEYKFKYEYANDVYIVGKMDRIIGEGSSIVDWKTSKNPPMTINNDIQFIMYYEAYKQIFNHQPANIYYAALSDGSLKILKPNQNNVETIYNEIIPRMIKSIKNGSYTHDGLFRYDACPKCQYALYCLRKKNVVASRELYNQ